MLTRQENELLCRVGPGTAMGELLREYWMPALRSAALHANGAPMRVRMLGETFVAFRAGDGRVGFFDEGCPHRCTSLALARNEDNALTCIFHGWKIDASGNVVEVPSEPPERRAEFAAKVRVRHYPVREAGGAIWVYLGRRQPPSFCDFEFNRLPANQCLAVRAILHANWLQVLEVTLDSSHLGILHSHWLRNPNSFASSLVSVNTGPTYDFMKTAYGFREAALRELSDGTVYTRIRELVAPFYAFVPADAGLLHLMQCPVPIDDEWSVHWTFRYDPWKPINPDELAATQRGTSGDGNNLHSDLGEFDQMWGQNREKMKAGHFTGMGCLQHEDWAVAESAGAIPDRTREHLGSSDRIVILYRRMMLQALHAHRRGKPAPGQEQEVDYGAIRAVTLRNAKGLDWRQIDPRDPPPSLPLR